MNAPMIDSLLLCFDRGHLNPSAPTERIRNAMEPLFAVLAPLAPLKSNNEAKAIWIKIPRGDISDYDSYEDMLEYGEVDTYEEYEARWKEEYPDEYKWYELVVVESFNKDGSLSFRAVALGNKTIISAMMDRDNPEYSYTEDTAVELCGLLTEAAGEAIGKLRAGTYQDEVDAGLPFWFKTGVIRRSVLWENDPEQKEFDLDGISSDILTAFKNRLSEGLNSEASIGRMNAMTANDFFCACAIGYKACGYEGSELAPVDQYFAHADGRDEGLSGRGFGLNAGPGIDFDDPSAWEEWYFRREQHGGHPWEIIRGGNSTHVDLAVCHDRYALDYKVRCGEMTAEEAAAHPCGYYYLVAGKHRAKEAVTFYTAISAAGLPVVLRDAEEILARFEGTDYVGIVPHSVIPKYCESMFPAKYGPVIDFMHVDEKEMELYGDQIEWLPMEEANLQEQ